MVYDKEVIRPQNADGATSYMEAENGLETKNDIKLCTLGDVSVSDVCPTSSLSFFILTNDAQSSFKSNKLYLRNE